ncbi:MAG: hypothetical protein JXQ66_02695 [Campylobacterales bacterium]|nr:hypothetical protein [Campylobacterales bacterium]
MLFLNKKMFGVFVSTTLIYTTCMAQDIEVKDGWQLYGATEDIEITKFDKECIDIIWKYDGLSKQWSAYSPKLDIASLLGSNSVMNKLDIANGFWVLGNGNCNITDPIIHNGVEYGSVTSPYTSRVWLDRNLGASQVCTAFDDDACFGDYYQWGRDADGHEKVGSLTTPIQATNVINVGHGDFITSSDVEDIPNEDGEEITYNYNNDWASDSDENGTLRVAQWSKTDGSSICPVGFRVPTASEIEAEIFNNDKNISNATLAYESFLKLPSAGFRFFGNGNLSYDGDRGFLWSNSGSSTYSSYLYFNSSTAFMRNNDEYRADGKSVRCIKN